MSGIDLPTAQSYVDTPLTRLLGHAEDLGDSLVSERPDLDGANSIFGLVTHCWGSWSTGAVRSSPADRATGTGRASPRPQARWPSSRSGSPPSVDLLTAR